MDYHSPGRSFHVVLGLNYFGSVIICYRWLMAPRYLNVMSSSWANNSVPQPKFKAKVKLSVNRHGAKGDPEF